MKVSCKGRKASVFEPISPHQAQMRDYLVNDWLRKWQFCCCRLADRKDGYGRCEAAMLTQSVSKSHDFSPIFLESTNAVFRSFQSPRKIGMLLVTMPKLRLARNNCIRQLDNVQWSERMESVSTRLMVSTLSSTDSLLAYEWVEVDCAVLHYIGFSALMRGTQVTCQLYESFCGLNVGRCDRITNPFNRLPVRWAANLVIFLRAASWNVCARNRTEFQYVASERLI